MMTKILLLLMLAVSSLGQTGHFDENFLVNVWSNIRRYAEYHFPRKLRETATNDLDTGSENIDSDVIKRTAREYTDSDVPVINAGYRMLVSEDSSVKLARSITLEDLRNGIARDRENLKAQRKSLSSDLIAQAGSIAQGAYKMSVSNSLLGQIRNVAQPYRMAVGNDLLIKQDSVAQPYRMSVTSDLSSKLSEVLKSPEITGAKLVGRSASTADRNITDILLKTIIAGANISQLSEYSEMLKSLPLWENILYSKHRDILKSLPDYYSQWLSLLNVFPINGLSKHRFQTLLNPLSFEAATVSAHLIDFSKLFWPFVYEINDNNQKLAIVGMTGRKIGTNQKTTFFEELGKLQNIKIPADENKIIYSFDDEELVRGMNRSGLESFDNSFLQKGSYLFTEEEKEEITRATDAALDLINSTFPEVYYAINRLVGCIAFYKSQSRVHMGGTVSSAIGLIWLDPSTQKPWSIPFYAEQIVHEFIHTSLFYADLVHGMFRDPLRLSEAKVVSAIRRQMRDYDKSLHAAYVSTGLITFHARAGYLERALALAEPLESSVKDLVKADRKHDVLDASGKAILKSMVDYLVAMRLYH